MRRRIGWVVLGLLWAGVGLRLLVFPLHLAHSGYPPVLLLILWSVDMLLLMPPIFLVHAMLGPSAEAWVSVPSVAVYLLVLSLLVYRFLLKR